MNIYHGDYLHISFEEERNLFVQYWHTSPTHIEDFKKEMLAYTSLYEKHRPAHTLWLQQNFSIDLDEETYVWIEKEVNEPCFAYGNQKCAFVVSADVLAHISVMDSFDTLQSCIIPRHFATEEEARAWLSGTEASNKNMGPSKITYEGLDNEGNAVIKVTNASGDMSRALKHFKKLKDQEAFVHDHWEKYASLTEREKEILKLVSEEHKHQAISEQLFVSIHTVRTHWKNVKNKLGIRSQADLLAYKEAFITKNTH